MSYPRPPPSLARHPVIQVETRYETREVAMVTSRSQTIRRRLGSVTLTGQGLGLGLGTSLFPVLEIKGLPWQPSRRIAGFMFTGLALLTRRG